MPDTAGAIVRFALYADLMLLFGLLCFATGQVSMRRITALMAIAGLALSLLSIAIMAAGMAGVPVSALDRATIAFVALGMPAGLAALVRIGALALLLCPLPRIYASAAAAIALATLAWNGHAAASDGWAHLGADMLHLLAAGAWIGAIALFIVLLWPRGAIDPARIEAAHRALAGFGHMGSVLVGIIVLTGLINEWFIIGADPAGALVGSLYGWLMLAKIALFVAMLGMAGINRTWLTPALRHAMSRGDTSAAIRALRISLGVEFAAAMVILALVACLGMIEPFST